MKLNSCIRLRIGVVLSLILFLTLLSTRMQADTGTCAGVSVNLPFTDVTASGFFCQIAEAYFSGLTNGTSPTTYSPAANVTRDQMAAFVTRTMDQTLRRGSGRSVLKRFQTLSSETGLGFTAVGRVPQLVESDGADLWVVNFNSSSVSRVRAGDGKLLETWTRANDGVGVVVVNGLIFVTGSRIPGELYQINPAQTAGPVTTLPISLGDSPRGIAFDGERIWTANNGASVSIVTLNPLSVETVFDGFISPEGILYDGANMWVTDLGSGSLLKLNANGGIIQTVQVGGSPRFPVFDGTNIWVPNATSNTVTVVRASTGAVLATLEDNGLDQPLSAAFDGERILVTNLSGFSLWKAADLSPIGATLIGSSRAFGACSDGLNFWVTLSDANQLARY